MELTLENIEKNNQISHSEFDQLAAAFYSSVSLTAHDDTQKVKYKAQTLDFLITFLTDYYDNQTWESEEEELKCLDLLAKLQLQKEVLHIFSSPSALKDTRNAIESFADKSQFPVGMR